MRMLSRFEIYQRNLKNMGNFNRIQYNDNISEEEKIVQIAELNMHIFLDTQLQYVKVLDYIEILCIDSKTKYLKMMVN